MKKEYYEKNKEKILEAQKEYRRKNKEKIAAYRKARYKKHSDGVKNKIGKKKLPNNIFKPSGFEYITTSNEEILPVGL